MSREKQKSITKNTRERGTDVQANIKWQKEDPNLKRHVIAAKYMSSIFCKFNI